MSYRVLIVEDEFFVAFELENIVAELGYEPVGIATDRASAVALAVDADIALVDINLEDGPTGPAIGRTLARDYGVTVIYSTANPSQLGDGVPGTVGVLPKPATEADVREAVSFAVALRQHRNATPPSSLHLFNSAHERVAVRA